MANKPIPSLIVGLGGSGAITVIHVKQQLLDMYHNEVPDTSQLLVFDTAQRPLAQMSGTGTEREHGMGYGKVSLGSREYGHLGGNARALGERIDRGEPEVAHMSNWFQAKWYLENLSETLWNLEDGAGQFRQLGRLALFKSVLSPNNSEFYKRINEKIITLRQLPGGGARSLAVFIVGSLAGGTGAGLFLDTAYLIRQIAAQNNMDVQLRGYFYLPDAFRSVLKPAELQQAYPRAFAALRELNRFVLHQDYKFGYPMYYHGPRGTSDPELWRGRLASKLYDLVYLVDGVRQYNPMQTYALEKGVSASVADAILGFIDSGAGEYQRSYIVNIGNQIASRQATEGLVPYVGAVGAYSIVLPIQQMIEGWAFSLARDTLQTLLMPSRYDDTTGYPLELAANANPERTISPRDELAQLLGARNAIADPNDVGRSLYPTALWPKIYQWYTQYEENDTQFVSRMGRFNLDDWMNTLTPAASDADQQILAVKRMTDKILSRTVTSEVPLSKETKGDPATDHSRIKHDVDNLFDQHLGLVKRGGQRDGGLFRDALSNFTQLQVERFREAFGAYIYWQLNGQDDRNPVRSRQGKLGWTLAVCYELDKMLSGVVDLIHSVQMDPRTSKLRETRLSEYDAAYNDMREMSTQGRSLRNPLQSPAHQAQETFRDTAENLFATYRTDIVREMVEHTVREMRDYTRSSIGQLENWRKVLALHHNGLYAFSANGIKQVETDRNQAEARPSRSVIKDPEWERGRYQTYLESTNALDTALSSIKWVVRHEVDEANRPRLRVVLNMGDRLFDDTERGHWSQNNGNILMEFCRSIFSSARNRESVLRYLSEYGYPGEPKRMADDLFYQSGALLGFDDDHVGRFVPGLYLLAYQDANHPEDIRFLDQVMDELRGNAGVGATDETLAHLQNCDDRFRLTLVSMAELLPLPRIAGYGAMEPSYKRTEMDRRLLHLFPAEVRAVEYEDRLTRELQQPQRMISNRVAVLMENIDRFRDFLALSAHGIIGKDRDYRDQKNARFVYFLTAPSKDPGRPDDAEEWWLTKPASGEPSLLEAMTTYIFRGTDYGLDAHIPNYTKLIDYPYVEQYLLDVRQYDTETRVTEGRLAQQDPDISAWLVRLQNTDEAKFNTLARIVVEHDVLKEYTGVLMGQMTALSANPQMPGDAIDGARREFLRNEQEMIDLYDLYSIAIVVLREMITNLRYDAARVAGVDPTIRRSMH